MRVPGGGPSLLVREGLTSPPLCTIVFILLYFSSLSSAVWWTITTTTWAVLLLCSLDQTSLASRAPLYHSLGWGLPAAFTVPALVLLGSAFLFFLSGLVASLVSPSEQARRL